MHSTHRPFQFSLLALMGLTAGVGLLVATWRTIGGIALLLSPLLAIEA